MTYRERGAWFELMAMVAFWVWHIGMVASALVAGEGGRYLAGLALVSGVLLSLIIWGLGVLNRRLSGPAEVALPPDEREQAAEDRAWASAYRALIWMLAALGGGVCANVAIDAPAWRSAQQLLDGSASQLTALLLNLGLMAVVFAEVTRAAVLIKRYRAGA
nr:hypothetical protein [Brevundimonas diminuta]